MFEKIYSSRTLTAKEIKIAISRYVHDMYGESVKSFKFHPDMQKWMLMYPTNWPQPKQRVIELTVDPSGNRIPAGLTAEEAFGAL